VIKITWDYLDISDLTNGKKAGKAYAGWDMTAAWDAVNGYFVGQDADLNLTFLNKWLNPTDYPTWEMSFEIERTSVGAIVKFYLEYQTSYYTSWHGNNNWFNSEDGGTVIKTVGINTWCTVHVRYSHTDSKYWISVDDSSEQEYTANAKYAQGIRWSDLEKECRIKNVVWDMDRPSNDGSTYLMKFDGFPDEWNTDAGTDDYHMVSGGSHDVKTENDIKCILKDATFMRIQTWNFTNKTVFSFKVKHDNGDVNFGFYYGSGSFTYGFSMDNNGKFEISNGTDVVQIDSADAEFTTATWYDIDWEYAPTTGKQRIRIDGGSWSAEFDASAVPDDEIVAMFVYNGDAYIGNIITDEVAWVTPALTSPANISMTEGDAESVSWTPSGDTGTYTIKQDSVTKASGSYTTAALTYDLSSLDSAVYSFVCTITDGVDIITDTVSVTVNALPTLNAPIDIEIDQGDEEDISWTPTGAGGSYSLEQDEVEVDTGVWTTGNAITYDLSSLAVDIYSFKLTITDANGSANDTVQVTVSGDAPVVDDTVDKPSSAAAETGSQETNTYKIQRGLNVLTHEPDNVIKKYQRFRKQW